jgi:tetratricopeptide (TPR) repeat protein
MAYPLLLLSSVDRGVIATASELFEGRHYPSVVALCSDALDEEPECVPLLLLRARAHVALRRDLDAQGDLRDVIRLDPQCALAYRLLGELAMRRDEHDPAIVFFREALRLDPGDREAADRLRIANASLRPAAVAQKLPAPATAAGRFPSAPEARRPRESQPRFARGTQQPGTSADPHASRASQSSYDPHGLWDERPTKPFARGSERQGGAGWAPTPTRPIERVPSAPDYVRAEGSAPPQRLRSQPQRAPTQDVPDEVIPLVNPKHGEYATIRGQPASNTPPAKPAPRLSSRSMTRSSIPEQPGFGEYLVASGILTRERLRAAQAYQRSMKVQLSTAIVTLGLATPQRIEWASVAHQTQLARGQQ